MLKCLGVYLVTLSNSYVIFSLIEEIEPFIFVTLQEEIKDPDKVYIVFELSSQVTVPTTYHKEYLKNTLNYFIVTYDRPYK